MNEVLEARVDEVNPEHDPKADNHCIATTKSIARRQRRSSSTGCKGTIEPLAVFCRVG